MLAGPTGHVPFQTDARRDTDTCTVWCVRSRRTVLLGDPCHSEPAESKTRGKEEENERPFG